ncbi:MAG TPA: DegT/DnrJ/EryC1/StrS family aminotransferase [Acidimicrobiales bacterium]
MEVVHGQTPAGEGVVPLPSDQDASGRTFGDEELVALRDVIESGTLTSTKGDQVARFEAAFADLLGAPDAVACATGSAAVQVAVAALDPEPGEEIVTTPITDMGALSAILYQGAIPAFADVDPLTGNVTAATIEASLSERTRAIVVTHLFGNPCEMAAIEALAADRGLPIIEDAAQALLATEAGRNVGTIGTLGSFSLQQGKHVTTGEGGVVVTSDGQLARRARVFVNKAWPYGEANPDHEFLAPNFRWTELQGAVANAQLPKLPGSVRARQQMAALMTDRLTEAMLEGIVLPVIHDGAHHSYWKYCVLVDPDAVPGGTVAMGARLRDRGIACAPRYISKPAFACQVFREQRTFGSSRWPFTLARPEAVDYNPERFTGVTRFLDTILVLPWNERYEQRHVHYIADALIEAHAALQSERAEQA